MHITPHTQRFFRVLRNSPLALLLALSLGLGALLLFPGSPAGLGAVTAKPMPEFLNQDPQRWVNSKPLTLEDFKGQVVLIEIWTSI